MIQSVITKYDILWICHLERVDNIGIHHFHICNNAFKSFLPQGHVFDNQPYMLIGIIHKASALVLLDIFYLTKF